MEFDTEEALKTYLRIHPGADPANHSVKKKTEGGGEAKEDDQPRQKSLKKKLTDFFKRTPKTKDEWEDKLEKMEQSARYFRNTQDELWRNPEWADKLDEERKEFEADYAEWKKTHKDDGSKKEASDHLRAFAERAASENPRLAYELIDLAEKLDKE